MIVVITEHRDGRLATTTNELIVFAQRAGRDLGIPVCAAVLGSAEVALDALKAAKIDRILAVEDVNLGTYDPNLYVHAIKAIVDKTGPALIIAAHTTQGMDF